MPRDWRQQSPKDWSPKGKIPGAPIWPDFVDAYLEAALWTSHDVDGVSLDLEYSQGDFSKRAVLEAIQDSNEFIAANLEDLESVATVSSHGHDFWLVRNGFGAGFRDRGYGAVGKRLYAAARKYSEQYVYVSDQGELEFE